MGAVDKLQLRKRWNFLRIRYALLGSGGLEFAPPVGFNTRVRPNLFEFEFGPLLFLFAQQLLFDAVGLFATGSKKQKLWDNYAFLHPSSPVSAEDLVNIRNRRNSIAHETELTKVNKVEFESLIRKIGQLLEFHQIIDAFHEQSEYRWFSNFDDKYEKTQSGLQRNGRYGVEIAKTGFPVYFYSFTVGRTSIDELDRAQAISLAPIIQFDQL